ncbi:hypothetical protein [Corynebacterium heidelbergense]|uniref:WG repeat-containing protein n=1 Tax=Corynebacterium heidelbergense TaxID=2055947 RepID=A0A364V9R5_9CORY|nr:hypothetical protein [Corynebacterium heidelbergense]RAV33402.1 hypothetical protein CWC39_08710 [Corynebacterium heidelbergense]WCZ36729.1 hypothetical protein CHEID_05960 [Corynebacterium heidelbergense]
MALDFSHYNFQDSEGNQLKYVDCGYVFQSLLTGQIVTTAFFFVATPEGRVRFDFLPSIVNLFADGGSREHGYSLANVEEQELEEHEPLLYRGMIDDISSIAFDHEGFLYRPVLEEVDLGAGLFLDSDGYIKQATTGTKCSPGNYKYALQAE